MALWISANITYLKVDQEGWQIQPQVDNRALRSNSSNITGAKVHISHKVPQADVGDGDEGVVEADE